MKTLTVNDLKVAYLDEGPRDGEIVILAHCASASGKEWSSLIPLLVAKGFRVLVPDFIGYGRSAPWPSSRPFEADADVNILLALADLVKGPVHLVGHSHGGMIVLEAARKLTGRTSSLFVIEPTVFQLLHETGHKTWPMVAKMARRVEDAMTDGNTRKAARLFTSFWIGPLKWFFLPERHKRAISKSMAKVVLEFEMVDLAHRTPEHYASIKAPVQMVIGKRTRPPAKAVGDLLADVLPNLDIVWIRAGHMSPFTHKKQINQLVLSHLHKIKSGN